MHNISTSTFALSDAMHDKIHGLSIQLGEVYAQLYQDNQCPIDVLEASLESYKNARRMLPIVLNAGGEERHQGHASAFESTNGDTINLRYRTA